MNFSQALDLLKAGRRVARSGWNGNRPLPQDEVKTIRMWLVLIRAGEVEVAHAMHEHFGLRWHPFIAMCPVGGGLVPWLASQTDLLADDWEVVD